MGRIAVLDDYQAVALKLADWSKVAEHGDIEVFHNTLADPDQLVERLRPFEIIVGMRERTPFPAAVLERLPNLKLLITTGSRNRSFDLAAAAARGITVCGTRSVGSPTVELTWGLILALARRIAIEDQNMRRGGWQSTLGFGLRDKVLGVVGLGNLGSQVAKIGLAFGMKVVAWSENLTRERASQIGVGYIGTKEGLCNLADVVTIHMILSERSRNLIGEAELRAMKPTTFLVNTSRGPIVNEAALVTALQEQWIAGAGLDVYDTEPLPADHPLRGLPNTVLTPHLGYVEADNYLAYFNDVVEDILAFVEGKPIRVMSPQG